MPQVRKDGQLKARIVVAGDLAVDWFEAEASPEGPGKAGDGSPRSWRTSPLVRREAKPGGAWLLADFLRAAAGADVLAPPAGDVAAIPAGELVQKYIELGRFPLGGGKKDDKTSVFRVRSFKGSAGPEGDRASAVAVQGTGRGSRALRPRRRRERLS